MPWIRRNWSPEAAEEWTKEDFLAAACSSLSYVLLMIGAALVFLVPLWGTLLLILGIAAAAVAYWLIDPKLKTASHQYEAKQSSYLKHLDRQIKWEEDD